MTLPTLRPSGLRILAVAAVAAGATVAQAASLPALQTVDKVSAYVGVFQGGSLFTPGGGGRTGAATDHAVDFGRTGSGPVRIANATFLNEAAANDEMSFVFWQKKYDTAASSAFWAASPTSNQGQRGFQAHVPWIDNSIFFDTAGCCDATTQRISASVNDFPDYANVGDVSWWTNTWRLLVFSKKGEVKQVWIDGELFLEGVSTAPLPTDFTDLFLGGDAANGNLTHSLMDDFAVFGTALTGAQITEIKNGTLPTALPASAKLLAYWDFNDFPAGGQFVSVTPAPNATGANPDRVQVVHIDGAVAWDASQVALKVDGVTVTPTFTRDGTRVTLTYTPNPLFKAQSTHTVVLTYPVGGGATADAEWSFSVGPYTKDAVASRIGSFRGGASYTAAGEGRSGAAGDYGVEFGRANTGPVFVQDGSFLNVAAQGDDVTFSFWQKKYDIANSSAFWANAPSSGGSRGAQAHVPWSDNQVYFDTAGCCDATTQRINESIEAFGGYTGDTAWWTNDWHHFVFTKNGPTKQIWIDGQYFFEGYSESPLPTDFTTLFIGSNGTGGEVSHARLDDFAVFGTALSEAQIGQLFSGTRPTALPASAQLLALWDFNDMPPEGLFVSFTPAAGVTDAVPNLIRVVHQNGTTPWDLTKVSLKVDGSAVNATVTREGDRVTVTYVPATLFAPLSRHTATLDYPDGSGGTASYSWSFTVGVYTKDAVAQHLGTFTGATRYTADAGGRTGQAGDYAVDFGRDNAGQGVNIVDASFLNAAAANDELSLVAWQKLYQIADSALFWGTSPSSSGSQRGFSVHTPWSNNTLYFDTAGCCDGATQRINASIVDFPSYAEVNDVVWWQAWRHLVFQKKGSTKEIWIDGELFLLGDNTNPLPTDFTTAWLGFDPPDNARLRGLLDDVAFFRTALTEAQIGQLANGASPKALPASAGMIALFEFNDPPAGGGEAPTLSIARDGANVRVTWSGGSLESADAVNGPWSAVAGATSPATIPASAAQKFYRARN